MTKRKIGQLNEQASVRRFPPMHVGYDRPSVGASERRLDDIVGGN
jgi:hypothetical protein